MFLRLLFESFRRQKRRKSVALLAIALGMTIATAMIAMAAGIGDKISQELRATGGANLKLTPIEDTLDVNLGGVDLKPARERPFIAESDLPKIKSIFWRNNITGFVPYLAAPAKFRKHDAPSQDLLARRGPRAAEPPASGAEGFTPKRNSPAVWSAATEFDAELIGTYFAQTLTYGKESFTTGARTVNGWWHVDGAWPEDYAAWPKGLSPAPAPDVLAGNKLAQSAGLAVGDEIEVSGKQLRVSGILSTGGAEDLAIVAPLHIAQQILGQPNSVQRVLINARTKPEDAFARRDPRTLSGAIYDRWYCSPYANSIAFQIQEALPNVHVEQVRQVEQNQGRILRRVSGLMLLLTLAALAASMLAVSAAMAGTILERRHEVGLMKSLGASNLAVASLFLTEAGLLAIAGGAIGFLSGTILAHRVGQNIFGSAIDVHPVVLAVVICAALLVTFLGSAGAVRKAMRFDPAIVLRGDA